MQDYKPLGGILVAKGKLTQDQLDAALQARRGQKRRLGSVLVSMGCVSEDDIAESLGEQYDLQVVDVAKLTPDPIALRILDPEGALKSRMLPLRFIDNTIECVIADPVDVCAIDMISRVTSKNAVFLIAPISALLDAIRRAYGLSRADRRRARSDKTTTRRRDDRGALIALIEGELGPVAVRAVHAEN